MKLFIVEVSLANPLVTEPGYFVRYFEHLFIIIQLKITWIIGIHHLPNWHLHWHLHLHALIGLIISVVKLNRSSSLH